MTLDELVVENFGIYRDRQTISLTPPSRKKSIVLFGGMNGAGKTTILDALQLGLHGKRARCSNRGSGSYDDFLRSCINRYVAPSAGASIEVSFHHEIEGQKYDYRVCRHWHENASGLKETVDVFVDGIHDAVVSDSWAEYAEEFIPARLSHLFFFDGEKIEALADLDNASELLRSGIHTLLGLDIVDRLITDLDVVATRQNKLIKLDADTVSAQEQARRENDGLVSRKDELVQSLGSIRSQLEQTRYLRQKTIERLQCEGGDLFKEKGMLEMRRTRLAEEIDASNAILREHAGGDAPLLLAGDLLESMHQQSRRERAAAYADLLSGVLHERDALVLKSLEDAGATGVLVGRVSAMLTQDRSKRSKATNTPRYLSFSEEAHAELQELRSFRLPDIQLKMTYELSRRAELAGEQSVVERKLSMVPEESAIAPLEADRKLQDDKCKVLEERRVDLEEQLRRLGNEINRKESTMARLRDEATNSDLEQEDVARIKQHSTRAQDTLRAFREKVIERHIASIQDHVLESFRYLVRKKSLLSSITIDTRTFAVQLRAADGKLINPDRLSAGERQLLAVSLLWGLAKASPRPLPAVIDTPLGRLDSSHRRHLVQRYFPHASHQVILLSTDEEIRGEYFDAIRPCIGHSYLLEFNEIDRTSTVKPGYFEQESIHVS